MKVQDVLKICLLSAVVVLLVAFVKQSASSVKLDSFSQLVADCGGGPPPNNPGNS